MSYIKYAEHEFELNPDYKEVGPILLKLLEIVGDEGHSGGSIGWFSGAYRQWAKDPKELPLGDNPDDLFNFARMINPLWNVVKELEVEKRDRILGALYKLMKFEPLSPLTGEDDEWNEVGGFSGPGGKTTYQNRRHCSIFKDGKDGQAYNSSGLVRGTPSDSFRSFIYFSSRWSRTPVDFPFSVEDNPVIREEYEDDDYTKRIDVGGDRQAWLANARKVMRTGIHPLTGNIYDRAWYLSIYTERNCEVESALEAIVMRRGDMTYEQYDQAAADAIYVALEGGRIDFKFSKDNVLPFSSKGVLLTVLRLVEEIGWDNLDAFDPSQIKRVPIRVPGKNYKNWLDEMFAFTTRKIGAIYMEDEKVLFNGENEFNPNKYLYKRCKDLGLAYKGRKHARA